MNVQIELWQLVSLFAGLLVSFLTFVFVGGRLLLGQIDQRIAARFSSIEQANSVASRHWDEKFAAVQKAVSGLSELEREFLRWKADLPLHYVRREDYVRNQTVIEAKLDALYKEMTSHKGATHG